MEAKAIGKYIRISPLKVRRVANLIRGRRAGDALDVLRVTPSPSARAVEKVVKSAVANAENNYEMSRDELVVTRILVDQGPSQKRAHPRARGRRDMIIKRSAHITVVVGDRGEA